MYLTDKLIIALVLFMVAVLGIYYFNQQTMNDVRSEVFGNITNTTTNKEIVGYIHTACSNTPWYVLRVDCENSLLKTFITPKNAGY